MQFQYQPGVNDFGYWSQIYAIPHSQPPLANVITSLSAQIQATSNCGATKQLLTLHALKPDQLVLQHVTKHNGQTLLFVLHALKIPKQKLPLVKHG
jgi:hypothetical protein